MVAFLYIIYHYCIDENISDLIRYIIKIGSRLTVAFYQNVVSGNTKKAVLLIFKRPKFSHLNPFKYFVEKQNENKTMLGLPVETI